MIFMVMALLVCLKVVCIFAVAGIFMLCVDMIWYETHLNKPAAKHSTSTPHTKLRVETLRDEAKTRLREQKEQEARDAFFDEGYFRGFDETGHLIYRGATAPSDPDWDFFKEADKVADARIFETTEDI